MNGNGITHTTHHGRQIKRLVPEIHGRAGYRVVSTGQDFKLLRDAKQHVEAMLARQG